MTKRHYILFAEMLRDERQIASRSVDAPVRLDAIDRIEDAMISIFYRDNSKFRANEFKEASAFALQPPVEDTSWNG